MNGLIRRRAMYDYGDPTLLYSLDADTVGNTNALWIDSSIYSRNATQNTTINQPILTDNVFGTRKGYYFDGTNDGFAIPDSNDLTFSNGSNDLPFSISVLIQFDRTKARHEFILKQTNITEYQLMYYNGTLWFACYNSLGRYILAQKTINLTTLTTYHLVYTYDGSGSQNGFEFYVDKVKQTSLTRSTNGSYTTMSNTTSPVIVNVQSTNGLKGYMTDLKCWNKCLTQTEIDAL